MVTALLARLLLGKKKDFFTILKIKGTAYMISIQPYVSPLEAFKKAVNKEMNDLKMTYAIRTAVSASAQDSDLVAGLVDRNKLILGDDGKITGLDEQVKALKESKPFLFKAEDNGGKKGFFRLSPKDAGGSGGESHMSMKEAIAAKLNMGSEGKE